MNRPSPFNPLKRSHAASHGCVRLLVSDAKWIYDNCKEGTIITVYEGEYDPEYTMTLKPTLNTSTLRENPLPSPTAAPFTAVQTGRQSTARSPEARRAQMCTCCKCG